MSKTTDKAARVAALRNQAKSCLTVCRMEMRKARPDLDSAHAFASQALRNIEILRFVAAYEVKA